MDSIGTLAYSLLYSKIQNIQRFILYIIYIVKNRFIDVSDVTLKTEVLCRIERWHDKDPLTI